jgi:hypothetical protein
MKRLVLVSSLCALVMLLSASSAFAWSTIASESASGEYAVAVAAGNADSPSQLKVRIKSRPPHQKVSVAWDVVCSRGFGAGTKSGQFSGYTNLTHVLKMSYAHPSSCTASVSAQLTGGGGLLKVKILAQ